MSEPFSPKGVRKPKNKLPQRHKIKHNFDPPEDDEEKKPQVKEMLKPELLYEKGRRLLLYQQQEPEIALKYLEEASKLGSPGASWDLSCLRQHSSGITFDWKKAVGIYRKHIHDTNELASATAWKNLGRCYFEGWGVRMNPTRSIECFRHAAALNLPAAQHNLGLCYNKGFGVERDPKKAFEHALIAAQSGLDVAQTTLGDYYYSGEGCDKDVEQCIYFYSLAAAQDLACAQDRLGLCYEKGIGVQQDIHKAVELYRTAAEQRYHKSRFALGDCYFKGMGVEKDVAEGLRWQKLAADGNYAAAQNYLALCYHKGIGVERDDVQACEYWKKATKNGDGDLAFKCWNSLIDCLQSDSFIEAKFRPAETLLGASQIGGKEKNDVESKNEKSELREAKFVVPTLLDRCCRVMKGIQQQCGFLCEYDTEFAEGRGVGSCEDEWDRISALLPNELLERVKNGVNMCCAHNCKMEFYGTGKVSRWFVEATTEYWECASCTYRNVVKKRAREDRCEICDAERLVAREEKKVPVFCHGTSLEAAQLQEKARVVVLEFCSVSCWRNSLTRKV